MPGIVEEVRQVLERELGYAGLPHERAARSAISRILDLMEEPSEAVLEAGAKAHRKYDFHQVARTEIARDLQHAMLSQFRKEVGD